MTAVATNAATIHISIPLITTDGDGHISGDRHWFRQQQDNNDGPMEDVLPADGFPELLIGKMGLVEGRQGSADSLSHRWGHLSGPAALFLSCY